MRLGIFGGTFNPPHMGHIRLVTAIADKLQLDRVLIIPASVPPHKHVLNLARSRDRFEMCRLRATVGFRSPIRSCSAWVRATPMTPSAR